LDPCFFSENKAKAGTDSLITDAFKAEDVWSFIGVLAGERCLLISDSGTAINRMAALST
jgi:hypothetical protein